MEGSGACLQMQLMQCSCLPGVRCYDGADIRQVGSKLTPCWFLFYIMKLHFFFPHRRKLQVVDMRDVHQDFWDVWTGKNDGVHSADEGIKEPISKHVPKYALRRLLKVVTDLSLFFYLNTHQRCFLQWAQQRNEYVRLCCLKMKILAFPVENIKWILNIFHPNYIEELEIYTNQVLPFLSCFAPCFGQMRNLLRFHVCQIYLMSGSGVYRFAEVKRGAAKFLSQFSKLKCLQHLSMNGDYFSRYHMKHLFR